MPKTILKQRALDNFLGFKKEASGQLHSQKKKAVPVLNNVI